MYSPDWREPSHHPATFPSGKTSMNLSQAGAKPFNCSLLPTLLFLFLPATGGWGCQRPGLRSSGWWEAESYSAQSTRGYPGADQGVRVPTQKQLHLRVEIASGRQSWVVFSPSGSLTWGLLVGIRSLGSRLQVPSGVSGCF